MIDFYELYVHNEHTRLHVQLKEYVFTYTSKTEQLYPRSYDFIFRSQLLRNTGDSVRVGKGQGPVVLCDWVL